MRLHIIIIHTPPTMFTFTYYYSALRGGKGLTTYIPLFFSFNFEICESKAPIYFQESIKIVMVRIDQVETLPVRTVKYVFGIL